LETTEQHIITVAIFGPPDEQQSAILVKPRKPTSQFRKIGHYFIT